MKVQKSFSDTDKGHVYIVPTPIGNLEDITFRSLKTLETVKVIAAEDTRHTKKLLNHFDIHTPLISYHEHNKESREIQLLNQLEQGESIAVVSDAGMPSISDPGYELVQAAIQQDISVIVLPGANAALCALVGSGLPAKEFLFYGFLPRKKTDKQSELKRLSRLKATLIFYESPYRLKDTLQRIEEHFGDRQAVIARELTKRFEEYVRGSVDDLIYWSETNDLKGEYCLVISGQDETEDEDTSLWWSPLSIVQHVNHYITIEDVHPKTAIKRVAKERQMVSRDVYEQFHNHK